MPDQTEALSLYVGIVLGMLLRDETAAEFGAVLASDAEGRDRVWRYTQAVRDRLTVLLRQAGRE
jgi:hypothetical protein